MANVVKQGKRRTMTIMEFRKCEEDVWAYNRTDKKGKKADIMIPISTRDGDYLVTLPKNSPVCITEMAPKEALLLNADFKRLVGNESAIELVADSELTAADKERAILNYEQAMEKFKGNASNRPAFNDNSSDDEESEPTEVSDEIIDIVNSYLDNSNNEAETLKNLSSLHLSKIDKTYILSKVPVNSRVAKFIGGKKSGGILDSI